MISGILLAAGKGSRFGNNNNKLLHPLPDGTPVAVAAARKLVSVLPDSLAVIRPGEEELARLLAAEGLKLAVNQQAERGIGSSLACGVAAAAQVEGWVIALGDMPFIQTATLGGIVDLLKQGACLAAPDYAGKRGHPVGFSQRLRGELEALQGDTGARRLLQRYAQDLQYLRVADPGILQDIDTPLDIPANYSLSIINYQLSIINYQLSIDIPAGF
jgi:molybdenum cofactor cytidylyltransferase